MTTVADSLRALDDDPRAASGPWAIGQRRFASTSVVRRATDVSRPFIGTILYPGDADMIVTLRNALPLIAGVVEAAEPLTSCGTTRATEASEARCGDCEACRLAAALAGLRAFLEEAAPAV